MLPRLLAGMALAALAAALTWRWRLLSPVGSCLAGLLGVLAVGAGTVHAALLLAFFIPAALLSRWRRTAKARLAGSVLDDGEPRTGTQVLANGAVFGLLALLQLLTHEPTLAVAAFGALAAAAADTWATEVGIGSGVTPRALRTLRLVPHGTSGAVSLPGSLAMLGGATWMGTVGAAAGLDPGVAAAVAIGGAAGALGDTLLGATVQQRRWCAACAVATERQRHDCGSPTDLHGGWRVMTNDLVNLLGTAIGAGVSWVVATSGA